MLNRLSDLLPVLELLADGEVGGELFEIDSGGGRLTMAGETVLLEGSWGSRRPGSGGGRGDQASSAQREQHKDLHKLIDKDGTTSLAVRFYHHERTENTGVTRPRIVRRRARGRRSARAAPAPPDAAC